MKNKILRSCIVAFFALMAVHVNGASNGIVTIKTRKGVFDGVAVMQGDRIYVYALQTQFFGTVNPILVVNNAPVGYSKFEIATDTNLARFLVNEDIDIPTVKPLGTALQSGDSLSLSTGGSCTIKDVSATALTVQSPLTKSDKGAIAFSSAGEFVGVVGAPRIYWEYQAVKPVKTKKKRRRVPPKKIFAQKPPVIFVCHPKAFSWAKISPKKYGKFTSMLLTIEKRINNYRAFIDLWKNKPMEKVLWSGKAPREIDLLINAHNKYLPIQNMRQIRTHGEPNSITQVTKVLDYFNKDGQRIIGYGDMLGLDLKKVRRSYFLQGYTTPYVAALREVTHTARSITLKRINSSTGIQVPKKKK